MDDKKALGNNKFFEYINKLLNEVMILRDKMMSEINNNNLLLASYYGFEIINKVLSISYEIVEDKDIPRNFKSDFKVLHDIVVRMNNNQPYDHNLFLNELRILPDKLSKYLKLEEVLLIKNFVQTDKFIKQL